MTTGKRQIIKYLHNFIHIFHVIVVIIIARHEVAYILFTNWFWIIFKLKIYQPKMLYLIFTHLETDRQIVCMLFGWNQIKSKSIGKHGVLYTFVCLLAICSTIYFFYTATLISFSMKQFYSYFYAYTTCVLISRHTLFHQLNHFLRLQIVLMWDIKFIQNKLKSIQVHWQENVQVLVLGDCQMLPYYLSMLRLKWLSLEKFKSW